MLDRISLHPGRVTLTPVAGEANTYDLVRADEPTQTGTPLNKASLLKDTTAALYDLTASAVPDDVLAMLPSRFDPKVGDTLQTLRTDLGENWLLCNGDPIKNSEYPELSPLLTLTGDVAVSGIDLIEDIIYINGAFVGVGRVSGYNPTVCTAPDPTGPWTAMRIADSTGSTSYRIYGIAYDAGTWVAVGYISPPTTGDHPYIFTATDLNGPWTGKQINSVNARLAAIAAHAGTWVAVGQNSSYDCFFVTTDPTGNWTYKTLGSSSKAAVRDIICVGNTWVIAGNTSGENKPALFTATDPTGTWTTHQLNTAANAAIYACAEHDGTWVAVGMTASDGYPYIFTATSLDGPWTGKQLSGTDRVQLESVTYCDGAWFAVGNGTSSTSGVFIYTATDPTGAWTEVPIGPTKTSAIYSIAAASDAWAAAGNGGVITNDASCLPTISVDGVYTYIKAKE